MTDSVAESGDRHGPNHVVLDVPPGGRDVALEVLQYRVGPFVNFEFYRTRRGQGCGEPVAPSALGPRRRCGDCLAARATAEAGSDD